jgi:hypothetical protein
MAESDTPLVVERFRLALELFDRGERMMRQRFRRGRPDATEDEVDAFVAKWLRERRGVRARRTLKARAFKERSERARALQHDP